MTLDEHPIDEDYIDPPKGKATVNPVKEERTPEEIDKTHTFLSGEAAETPRVKFDQSAVENNDGRGDHSSMFYGKDAPPEKREQFTKLASMNEGMWESGRDHKTKSNASDKANFARMCCSNLEMTDYQKERVLWLTERVKVNMFGHYSYEHVILALISIVANEDGRWVRDENTFRTMTAENGLGLKEIRRLRIMMKDDNRWETNRSPL